jgi:hypothetical protein
MARIRFVSVGTECSCGNSSLNKQLTNIASVSVTGPPW